jgi:hypothetical protein
MQGRDAGEEAHMPLTSHRQRDRIFLFSPEIAVGSITLSLPEINNTSRRAGTLL